MEKSKFQKLSLKKEKIARLNDQGMKQVLGGGTDPKEQEPSTEPPTSTCGLFTCSACTSTRDSSVWQSTDRTFTCNQCTTL